MKPPIRYRILKELVRGPNYGFGLNRDLGEPSFVRSSLYAVLRGMADEGLLTSERRESLPEKKCKLRVYYHLTDLGRDELYLSCIAIWRATYNHGVFWPVKFATEFRISEEDALNDLLRLEAKSLLVSRVSFTDDEGETVWSQRYNEPDPPVEFESKDVVFELPKLSGV